MAVIPSCTGAPRGPLERTGPAPRQSKRAMGRSTPGRLEPQAQARGPGEGGRLRCQPASLRRSSTAGGAGVGVRGARGLGRPPVSRPHACRACRTVVSLTPRSPATAWMAARWLPLPRGRALCTFASSGRPSLAATGWPTGVSVAQIDLPWAPRGDPACAAWSWALALPREDGGHGGGVGMAAGAGPQPCARAELARLLGHGLLGQQGFCERRGQGLAPRCPERLGAGQTRLGRLRHGDNGRSEVAERRCGRAPQAHEPWPWPRHCRPQQRMMCLRAWWRLGAGLCRAVACASP